MVRAILHEGHLDETGFSLTIPIAIPDKEQVRAFAESLHSKGEPWSGEVFGWEAEYIPHRSETETPAMFSIGDSRIWFYGLMWELDDDPTETHHVAYKDLDPATQG